MSDEDKSEKSESRNLRGVLLSGTVLAALITTFGVVIAAFITRPPDPGPPPIPTPIVVQSPVPTPTPTPSSHPASTSTIPKLQSVYYGQDQCVSGKACTGSVALTLYVDSQDQNGGLRARWVYTDSSKITTYTCTGKVTSYKQLTLICTGNGGFTLTGCQAKSVLADLD
jgi:hypothetical protein